VRDEDSTTSLYTTARSAGRLFQMLAVRELKKVCPSVDSVTVTTSTTIIIYSEKNLFC